MKSYQLTDQLQVCNGHVNALQEQLQLEMSVKKQNAFTGVQTHTLENGLRHVLLQVRHHSRVPGFKKDMLMDPQRFAQFEELYKGLLTENARFTKAACLVVQEHALLMLDLLPSLKWASLKHLAPTCVVGHVHCNALF